MLSKYFGKKEQTKIGYIYVPEHDEGILKDAFTGQLVRNKKEGPPWIVVSHSISDVIVSKWPGKLWRAEIVDEAKNTGLLAHAKYTRANGVKILELLPLEILFGDYGSGILKIIESARVVDKATAAKLASTFPLEALELYSKGWNIFGGTLTDEPPCYGCDHKDTIKMPGYEGGSPINCGFTVIYSQIFDRARNLTNGKAILSDDEGNLYLNQEWSNSCSSYLCAAMAIAYQKKFSENEIKILATAWNGVFGELPLMA